MKHDPDFIDAREDRLLHIFEVATKELEYSRRALTDAQGVQRPHAP